MILIHCVEKKVIGRLKQVKILYFILWKFDLTRISIVIVAAHGKNK